MSDDIAVADEEDALLEQETLPTAFPDDEPALYADDPTFVPTTELDEGDEVTE